VRESCCRPCCSCCSCGSDFSRDALVCLCCLFGFRASELKLLNRQAKQQSQSIATEVAPTRAFAHRVRSYKGAGGFNGMLTRTCRP
jgi:hypothetical protein